MSTPYRDQTKLTRKNKIIFTSFSKKNFYLRAEISKFVLDQWQTPISPFMNFDYNLSYLIKKDLIRVANNTLIKRADELWVFGKISDGVLMEIYLAKKYKKPIRYFKTDGGGLSFKKIDQNEIVLEDISPWMWDWVKAGKNLARWHPRLRFNKEYPLVYSAYSKKNFYWQTHISKFCLEKKVVPLNPFMLFRYFLGDAVPRSAVYLANNNLVRLCDELWTFGEISDGVWEEIKIKNRLKQPVKYFNLTKKLPATFRKVPKNLVVFEEPKLEKFRGELR